MQKVSSSDIKIDGYFELGVSRKRWTIQTRLSILCLKLTESQGDVIIFLV